VFNKSKGGDPMSSDFVYQSVASADCPFGKQPSWPGARCAACDPRDHGWGSRHGRNTEGRRLRQKRRPFPLV